MITKKLFLVKEKRIISKNCFKLLKTTTKYVIIKKIEIKQKETRGYYPRIISRRGPEDGGKF